MIAGVVALSLFAAGGQHQDGKLAEVDVLRGHPPPPATAIGVSRVATVPPPLPSLAMASGYWGDPEGWCARSARQRLPQHFDAGRRGVASAWARGGHPIP